MRLNWCSTRRSRLETFHVVDVAPLHQGCVTVCARGGGEGSESGEAED